MQTQHSTMVYQSDIAIPKKVLEAYKRWDSLLPGTILHNAAYIRFSGLCTKHKIRINQVIDAANKII